MLIYFAQHLKSKVKSKYKAWEINLLIQVTNNGNIVLFLSLPKLQNNLQISTKNSHFIAWFSYCPKAERMALHNGNRCYIPYVPFQKYVCVCERDQKQDTCIQTHSFYHIQDNIDNLEGILSQPTSSIYPSIILFEQ